MKQILSIIILFSSMIFAQDPIEVSPATLDFGNVLMGNSPTMSFIITANLDQDISISAPTYYESDITQVTMTDGQTQEVNITFNPPSIGNYDSFIALTGSTFGSANVALNAEVINNIEGALSGLIRAEYSPYQISGDIWVEEGDSLELEAGVELDFTGRYQFTVFGTLNINGSPDYPVVLKSSFSLGWWGLIGEAGAELNLNYAMISDVDINGTHKFPDVYIDGNGDDEYYTLTGDCELSNQNSYSPYYSFDFYDDYDNPYGNIYIGDSLFVRNESASISYWHRVNVAHSSYNQSSVIHIYNYTDNESFDTPFTPSTSWSQVDVSLASYVGKSIQVYISFAGQENLHHYIDDINIQGIGTGGLSLYESDATVSNTSIFNNASGIIAQGSNLMLLNVNLLSNKYLGLWTDRAVTNMMNSIIFMNNQTEEYGEDDQVKVVSGVLGISYSSFQSLHSGGIQGSWSDGGGNVESFPIFIDELYHLDAEFSPLIDAGNPVTQDNCIGPGLGTEQADIGMYGGPNNCGSTASSNLPAGQPEISHIVDLPQDQGGVVGIQYSASEYDSESWGYTITHYSIWRALDVTMRSEINASSIPISSVYEVENEFWEYVGEMDALGFPNYGISAPTLADSTTSGGVFWSKFLVVAHTDDPETFYVSEIDSGYSIDNTPPIPPGVLATALDENGLVGTWANSNPDIAYWDIFRNNEMIQQVNELSFTDVIEFGEVAEYAIRGVDIHENVGTFSVPFEVINGTLGDVTWDQNIDVLDATSLISMILYPEHEYSLGELWAADMNDDSAIDVTDLPLIIDIIMDGALSAMTFEEGTSSLYFSGNTLYLNSTVPVAGIQLRFDRPVDIVNLTDLSIQTRNTDIVLYTLSDEMLIGNNIPIVDISETSTIEEVIVSSYLGESIQATLDVSPGVVIPTDFAVHQNYPNPFNPSTTIKVDLDRNTHVKMTIYDMLGTEVRTMVNHDLMAGYHTYIWDGTNSLGNEVSSGIYFVRVTTDVEVSGIKATLLR